MHLVYGQDEIVCEFVASAFDHIEKFHNCGGLGIDVNGVLEAGVVIEMVSPFDAHITVFSINPKAWTRNIVGQIFTYLFDELKVARITCMAGKRNKTSRKVIEGLGFRHEGTLRKGLDGSRDAILYGMVREECRWIKAES